MLELRKEAKMVGLLIIRQQGAYCACLMKDETEWMLNEMKELAQTKSSRRHIMFDGAQCQTVIVSWRAACVKGIGP